MSQVLFFLMSMPFLVSRIICFTKFTMPQVELKEGPLEQFTHEMEPFLRKQGLPVRLNRGLQSPLHLHMLKLAKQKF